MSTKIAIFLGAFLAALFFAGAIIIFLSDSNNPMALFFALGFIFLLVGVVPLLFVIAWLRNENNIRERIKDVRPGSFAPEFPQYLLETMWHVLFH